MALNSVAKQHYDDAVALLSLCDSPDATNAQVMAVCAKAEVALGLAHFAVENHALIMGIDTDIVPPQPGTPGGMSGPKVWGA